MESLLTKLLDAMAVRAAQATGMSIEEATASLRILIEEARIAYRAAGAPFGHDDAGLVRYLTDTSLNAA
jgi:hypothetical protein